MPALDTASLVIRNATAVNATSNAYLQVVCAWPVSGQYYVLVAACVFARNVKWLRKACLAATLLFPAVAALHGIVLAAVPTGGGVDMDIFGAFQLCSIGILAAPVTVKVSGTYFNDPGRNAIFVWTGLILSGLLSLTVQFFRLSTTDCKHDDFGRPVSPNPSEFSYNTTCGLVCSVEEGPFSPMRGGSANDIYVIPAPSILTFGMGTLLSAACCIPAVLSLISMWYKILEIKWKTRFGDGEEEDRDRVIDGTNGATNAAMMGIKNQIRKLLLAVEIPLFGAAVLAILIIGERNFWSEPIKYQTEPIASIGEYSVSVGDVADFLGQWGPIAGTVLAVLGSLYLLLAGGELEARPETPKNDRGSVVSMETDEQSSEGRSFTEGEQRSNEGGDMARSSTNASRLERSQTMSTVDYGSRRYITQRILKFSSVADPAPDRFNDAPFKHGPAAGFPTLPGEAARNPKLGKTIEEFNRFRDVEGSIRPSRAPSFTGSSIRGPSPSPSRSPREGAFPFDRTSSEIHAPPAAVTRPRRDTLEVPTVVRGVSHDTPSSPTSPTIVISEMSEGER
ncbi:hypothetical protein V490_08122 [Pseudogymnoascus sp. VKM F-3557]|nr:hypothetical protein V490_08122 [Pseudogymnoascus sp. VKM F-3557]